MSTQPERNGQVLVLFALVLVVLLGFAALAIDISGAYAANRHYRAVADAAALAGAQDLQDVDARKISPGDYTNARTDAMRSIVDSLVGSGSALPSCPTTGGATESQPYATDVLDCWLPGNQYRVSIKTPSPNCNECTPSRAVQVTVREPAHPLSFARVLGQSTWNVSSTSVAGLTFGKAYALITLRPPRIAGNSSIDQNVDDLNLNGTNTKVTVSNGDIGVNTYVQTNADSTVTLDDGYFIFHYDQGPTPDSWNRSSGSPPGWKLSDLLQEPQGYVFPDSSLYSALHTYSTQDSGKDSASNCSSKTAGITWPVQTGVDPASLSIVCYKPGIYLANFTIQNPTDAAYLEPGVYFFEGNLTVKGYLFGGLQTAPGVTVVVDKANSFSATSAAGVILNAGPSNCTLASCRAQPAVYSATGNPVESPDGLPLTIMVTTDDNCFVIGTSPRVPQLCSDTSASNTGTKVINLGASAGSGGSVGSAIIRIGGVIWAPTDNVVIGSNYTAQQSFVGRIVTWSVTYEGGATLNEEGTTTSTVGVMRLDSACSPGNPCPNP